MRHPEMMQEIRRLVGLGPVTVRPGYLRRREALRVLRVLKTLALREVIPPARPSDSTHEGMLTEWTQGHN